MTQPFVFAPKMSSSLQRQRNAKSQRVQRLLAVWRERDARETDSLPSDPAGVQGRPRAVAETHPSMPRPLTRPRAAMPGVPIRETMLRDRIIRELEEAVLPQARFILCWLVGCLVVGWV